MLSFPGPSAGILEWMEADQNQHSRHAQRFHPVDEAQLSHQGGHGAQQSAQADAEGISTADQGIPPTGGNTAAAQRYSKFYRWPVEPCRSAQQQLAEQVSAVGVGPEQGQISQHRQQRGGAHRP